MGEEHKQSAIFITMITAIVMIILLALVFWKTVSTNVGLYVVLGAAVIVALVYWKSPQFFIQLQEYERAVVFHMGAFEKVAGPGWLFIIPTIESYKLVDLRVKTIDVAAQEVVTKDNVKLKIDAVLYTKVLDPKAAILNVEDYQKAASSNIQSSLRAVVGEMEFSEVLSNMKMINDKLRADTADVAKEWGISIDKVELQHVELPKGLQDAMTKQKEEVQKKLAAKEMAEGMKLKLDAIQESAGKFTEPTMKYMYLQSLNKMAEGKSSKFIIPMELSSLAQAVSRNMGLSMEEAKQEVASKFEKKAEKGESPKTILEELKKEYGIETKKLHDEIGKSKKTKIVKKK